MGAISPGSVRLTAAQLVAKATTYTVDVNDGPRSAKATLDDFFEAGTENIVTEQITAGDTNLQITGLDATSGNTAGGDITVTGGAGSGTGAGGSLDFAGGASGGGATGNGGDITLTGGASDATDGNGGSLVLTAGAGAGTGLAGGIVSRGVVGQSQGAPTAKTVSTTMTAAQIAAGIITVNQAAGAPSEQQLPTGTAMSAGFPMLAVGDAFDFSVINTSTVDAEDASITTNDDWSLVGNMDIPAYSAAGSLNSSGLFRARKTGAATWTLYRIG